MIFLLAFCMTTGSQSIIYFMEENQPELEHLSADSIAIISFIISGLTVLYGSRLIKTYSYGLFIILALQVAHLISVQYFADHPSWILAVTHLFFGSINIAIPFALVGMYNMMDGSNSIGVQIALIQIADPGKFPSLMHSRSSLILIVF